MKKRRLLSILLAAAMMVSMLPAWTLTARAADPSSFVTDSFSPLPESPMCDVDYGNGVYVAVGNYHTILTSADADTWTAVKSSKDSEDYDGTPAANISFYGVAFGNGVFVAGGTNGVLLSSTDGSSWTRRTSDISAQISEVEYLTFNGVGAFYALTNGGFIKSTDGINWSMVIPTGANPSYQFTEITVGENGAKLALGESTGKIYYTTDGVAWTSTQPTVPAYSTGVNMLRWVNDRYFISDPSAYLWTSSDLSSFTLMPSPFKQAPLEYGTQLFQTLYDGSKYYLFGTFSPYSYGCVLTSTDATNWSMQPYAHSFTSQGVAYVNGKYFRLGNEGMLVSSDGASWEYKWGGVFYDIAYDGSKYIAAGRQGDNGAIWTSPDRQTWTQRALPSYVRRLSSLAYGGGKYVALSDTKYLLTSNDGTDWAVAPNAFNGLYMYDLAYGNGVFVAVGTANGSPSTPVVRISNDGASWSTPTLPATGATMVNSVTWINNQFVAVGGDGVSNVLLWTSPDGSTWTDCSSYYPEPSDFLMNIVWDGARYILMGETADYTPFTRTGSDLHISGWSSPAPMTGGNTWEFGAQLGISGTTLYALTMDWSTYDTLVYCSENGGATWQDSGLTNGGAIPAAFSEANGYLLIGGYGKLVMSSSSVPDKTPQDALVYDDVFKTYGDAAFTPTATGGSGTGAVTYSSGTPSVASIDADSGEVTIHKAGSATLTVNKAGDAAYAAASASCTLTVGKAVLTATVGDSSKTYGDANPAFPVAVTGFVYGETAATATGYTAPTASCAADTATGAGTAQITIGGGTADNYTLDTSDTGMLTINPKSLSLTVTANSKPYDGNPNGSGTITLSGILNSDDVTASGTFTFADQTAQTGKTVNVSGITLGGAKANNYTLSTTSAAATANITAKPVSIASVTIADKVYDGTTTAFISAASLSGAISGDEISVDYSGATAAFDSGSVGSGKTVSITGLSLAGSAKDNYSLSSGSFTTTGRIINAGTVLTPTVDVAAGMVASGTIVTLSCATTGATIYYTTNGSTPTAGSTPYAGHITISGPTTLKAIAVKEGMGDSGVMSAAYTIAAAEQFSLAPGGTYYFDLSGQGVPGIVSPFLPDIGLKWVPFTYAGTVNAYSLDASAGGNPSASAAATPSDRSLFVANWNITRETVSWDALNSANLIFGKPYQSGGVSYQLRSLSVGSWNNGKDYESPDLRGTPESNEWDQIANKSETYIKKWTGIYSWGQDTTSNPIYRQQRGYWTLRSEFSDLTSNQAASIGFRPALQITSNTSTALKTVTYDMGENGIIGAKGASGTDLTAATVVYTGTLTLPAVTAANGFTYTGAGSGTLGWYAGSTFYTPGETPTLPSGTTLTAGYGTAPTITVTDLPGGMVGIAYSQPLSATGNEPITWSIESGSLPAGLTLSGSTIAGTPTQAGTASFTVKAENSLGVDTKALSLTIIPNHAPTLTTVNTLTGATEDTAYTIDYSTLSTASNASDADGDTISFRVESVTTGTLTKNSTAIIPGTTTLATGESLVWTPAANANGTLDAFTVKAYDGKDASATAVQVKVSVAAVNDTPVGVPTVSGIAAVGQTLTASTDGISDADGLGNFSYQWQVSDNGSTGWTNIAANATSTTYIVTSNEAGKYTRVAVSYTDGGSIMETVYSDALGPNKTPQAELVYGDVTKTYGDAVFFRIATGGSGTGAVTYSSDTPSVASIDADSGEVTIHKAGSATLTVNKAGDAAYAAASASCTLTVDKAVLTATVGDSSKTYGDANPAFPVAVTGFVYGETAATAAGYTAPTASCAADTATGAGTAQITIGGGTANNYTLDTSDTGMLTINPKSLPLTVTAYSKPYDGNPNGSGTITLSGILNSDDVTASGTFTFADQTAQTGKTVNVSGITLGGAKANNYTLSTTSAAATANITAKPVSIASVTIADKVYDGTTTASISAASLSGTISGDEISVDYSGATAAFDSGSVGSGKTVSITGLSLAGGAKDNYSLSSGSFTTTGRIINAGTVLTPTVDVAAGTVTPNTLVTLSCATPGADIYYTTDGDAPTSGSTPYSDAITISAPTTIKAIAIKAGMNDSSVMSAVYTITPEVTATNTSELETYINSSYVAVINLVSGVEYTYNGTTVTRPLTINGHGATINVGTGFSDTIVKKESTTITGPVFLAVQGGSLTMNNVTLRDTSTRILAAINVKTGGTLLLDGVTFDGFFANKADDSAPTGPNMDGSHNNFGVHAEPGAVSTTVKNCTFGSSNSFRNAIAIRNGTAVIQNNTFVGTAMPATLNQTDGFEYAIYLYGGTCTVTGNNISGYDSTLTSLGYHSAAITTCPYYNLIATITGNNLHDNARGIDGVGSWHTYSEPARAQINGTILDSSANAFTIGQALKAANTFSGNTDGNISLSMDQNDYYIDTISHVEYGPPAYYDALLHLTSTNSTGAVLSFDTGEWARAMVRNAKAGSLGIEVSQDNGATWTAAATSAPLTNNSTGAAVSLAAGKTYLLRAVLAITASTRPVGSTDDISTDITCYSNTVSATISSGSSNETAPSGQGGASVIVNGESKTAGTAQTTTASDGRTTTTVTVDSGKLENILATEQRGATVIIPVAGTSDTAAGVLTGEMIKLMETQAATLVIKTETASYTLPASEINITAVSQQLGTNVALKDITVSVSIAEPSGQMSSVVESAAKGGGFTLMVPSVDYTVTCSYGGHTVKVGSFNAYVERTVAIPDGVDPSKITTGIVVNPDGMVHHVPTRITVVNGKYYAVINSLTNSTYSVIWHPIEFSDVTNHWAKASVNNLGSRMVVDGIGASKYEPDRDMTRAEFAAVMVRALGLAPEAGESGFNDVPAAEWYCGYVKTAAAYGIIKGYPSGDFGPSDTITREQAMTMIARAMKITKLKADLTDSEGSKLMAAYSDRATVSAYANTSIAECIKTGVVSGRENNTLAPKVCITRAEVAVMVERLLQRSNLI